MNIQNFENYAAFQYENNLSSSDKFFRGDVVINNENEIGVIIQVHGNGEYRTDMFGNCDESEIRMATDNEIEMYRPNIMNEGTFRKDYTSVAQALKAGNFGTFINNNGEYCTVSRFYIKNTLKYQVVFAKGLNETATRPAINSVSEKKILKLLNSEGFKLV